MPFDAKKFESAEFVPRTRVITVRALSDFFGKDEEPVWEIRGLTSVELSKALAAKDTAKLTREVVEAIDRGEAVTNALKKHIGVSDDVPAEIAKRMEMLVIASVNPRVELPIAVKLAEYFPIQFLEITTAITDLTALGYDIQKPKAALQKSQS